MLETVHNLDHPLCHNLRHGNWLIDYTLKRLTLFPKVNTLTSLTCLLPWLSSSAG